MAARVLVVDDSPTILKVVSAILSRSGIVAQTARDGIAGLKLLAEEPPFDLILLDFVMPRMNGYQFCRELRKKSEFKTLPVVLMSAKGDRIRDQFVQQTGAVDAITKPFDARTLVAVVEGILAKVRDGRAPIAPEGETMPDEESLEASDEARPSALPGRLAKTANAQLFDHVAAAVIPAVLELREPDRANPATLERVIGKALEAAPIDALLVALREAVSATTDEVLSGDLAVVPLPEVLQLLQMQRQSGVMRAANGSRVVHVHIRDGAVDFARVVGARNEFQIGRYFVQLGLMKRPEIDAAVERSSRRGIRLGDLLVSEGRLTQAKRREALVLQTSEIVYDLVRWQAGRFWFARDAHPNEARDAELAIAMSGLVLEGFRRVDEWRLMEKTIVWEAILCVDQSAIKQLDLRVSEAENKVLSIVDGKRDVTQIVADCELARFDALKIIYQLVSSRVLRPIPRLALAPDSLPGELLMQTDDDSLLEGSSDTSQTL